MIIKNGYQSNVFLLSYMIFRSICRND